MTAPATLLHSTMPTIGVGELRATADLQARRDRKYLVPDADVEELVAGLGIDLRVLQIDGRQAFGYETVYFDTPDLALFHQAAHRRPRRAKVRVRTYRDSGDVALEVKTRRRGGLTVKHRRTLVGPRGPWSSQDRAWVRAHDVVGDTEAEWLPSLVVRYCRTTFLAPGSTSRLTIDRGLTFADPRAGGATPREFDLPAVAIVETKSAGAATEVDRALWRLGHRPTRVSKYGAGLGALRPELPTNPWHRAVHDHFRPSTARDGRAASTSG